MSVGSAVNEGLATISYYPRLKQSEVVQIYCKLCFEWNLLSEDGLRVGRLLSYMAQRVEEGCKLVGKLWGGAPKDF